MRKLDILLCAVAILAPGAGEAHTTFTPDSHYPALLVLPLSLLALAYAGGVWKLMRRGASPHGVLWRLSGFVLGLLLLCLVTVSPVAGWSERLFSTHMAQHLVLMLICAPLLVAARTTPALLRAIGPALKTAPPRGLLKFARRLFSPVAVWLSFTGLFLLWHLPGLYAAALRDQTMHALEHASFFLSAYAFWSVVMAPAGRHALGYGARLFFVVSAALLSGLPGALIALSSRPLYATDPQTTARLGLTPLEDQQLAGLVMWIPGGLAYLIAALALLLAWLRESERLALRKRTNGVALLGGLMLSITVGACDDVTPRGFGGEASPTAVTDGDPRKGAQDIAAIGCGACHTIPGINGAVGLVGPPLDRMGRRVYIAGLLRNTPENMQIWLQNPQRIAPGVVMPDMGVTVEQSRDIAAYLYTLR